MCLHLRNPNFRCVEKLQQQVFELTHDKPKTRSMDDRACLAVYGGFPRDPNHIDAHMQWLVNRIPSPAMRSRRGVWMICWP